MLRFAVHCLIPVGHGVALVKTQRGFALPGGLVSEPHDSLIGALGYYLTKLGFNNFDPKSVRFNHFFDADDRQLGHRGEAMFVFEWHLSWQTKEFWEQMETSESEKVVIKSLYDIQPDDLPHDHARIIKKLVGRTNFDTRGGDPHESPTSPPMHWLRA
ncbi:MAG: hypothetical protein Q7R79_01790 [bacterium]|nr:hypothetical protein [bacterium]